MIIAPSGFLLAAPAGAPPLTHPRILWRNRVANLLASAITVSGETAAGPRDAPTRPNTDEYWEPPALPASIVFDLGEALTIDGVGLLGNFGTCHTAVKVEVGTDPAFAADATFGEERMPDDDSAILVLDSARIGRYLRVGLTGSVPPKLAVASGGEVLAMEKAVSGPYKPISLARKTVLSGRRSRGGQFLGQGFRSHGLVSEAAFRNLSAAWVRAMFDPFAKSARGLPYFFAWNPSELPREVGYVWTVGEDIVPTHNGNGFDMDVSWEMEGIGHE